MAGERLHRLTTLQRNDNQMMKWMQILGVKLNYAIAMQNNWSKVLGGLVIPQSLPSMKC